MVSHAGRVLPLIALHPSDGSSMVSRRRANAPSCPWSCESGPWKTTGNQFSRLLRLGLHPGHTWFTRESSLAILSTKIWQMVCRGNVWPGRQHEPITDMASCCRLYLCPIGASYSWNNSYLLPRLNSSEQLYWYWLFKIHARWRGLWYTGSRTSVSPSS